LEGERYAVAEDEFLTVAEIAAILKLNQQVGQCERCSGRPSRITFSRVAVTPSGAVSLSLPATRQAFSRNPVLSTS
jgi:hypothetical protein